MDASEIFVSVDIETSGPVPGLFSLLSIGACLVHAPDVRFYAELKPDCTGFDPEALAVTGFNLQALATTGVITEGDYSVCRVIHSSRHNVLVFVSGRPIDAIVRRNFSKAVCLSSSGGNLININSSI